MERRFKEKDPSDSGSDLSLVDSIKKITYHNARAELDSEEKLLLFLQSWWSRTYNRPLKDPLLLSYSLPELLYEFYDRIERIKAEEERVEQQSDKIEEKKEKEALDWAEQEELREIEEAKAKELATKKTKTQSSPVEDPLKDPANIAWMEKQLQEAKVMYGDSFGEDIDDIFEE